VVSTGSLHHWKAPLACLKEAYRILKPGSYALIYDLVRNMPEDVEKKIKAEFGRFRFALLWLHSLNAKLRQKN
jgi:SAM-dependent methyltransferase